MNTTVLGKSLIIGSNSVINRKSHLDCRGSILIGNNVSISPECNLITASHDMNTPEFRYTTGNITIQDYVWIGTRAMILPNIEIGEGAVVCAGAVVTKNVNPYTIVAGIPAKKIGTREKGLNYDCRYFKPFD